MPLLSPLLLPFLIVMFGFLITFIIGTIGVIAFGLFLLLKALFFRIMKIKVSKGAGFWLTGCLLVASFVILGFIFGFVHR